MVNHTTIERHWLVTLQKQNQGYGEPHNNRDMGWLHSKNKISVMVNYTTIETWVGYTLETNQGYGEITQQQRHGLHSRTKLGLW